MKQLIWIAAALALAGCSKGSSGDSSGQSEAEAWRAACEVTRQRLDELNQVAPVNRQRLISEMIGSVLKNEKARATFGEIANQAPEQRGKTLAAAVAAAGVDDCHLARVLDHDQLVGACNGEGDAEACVAAAAIYEADQLFPGRRADSVGFRIAACTHGDGAQCAAVAKTQPSPADWLGRACRRGHQESCKGLPGSAVLPRLTVEATPDGPVADRIEKVYAASIADCLVGAGDRIEPTGEATMSIRPDYDNSEVEGAPGAIGRCLTDAVAAWRFADRVAEPVKVAVAWTRMTATAKDEATNEMLGTTGDGATGGMDERSPADDLMNDVAPVEESPEE